MKRLTDFSFETILMDGISDMVFVIKVEEINDKPVFIYDFFNQAAMDGTGMTNDMLGKPIRTAFSPDSNKFLYEQYCKVLQTNECVIYEDAYLSPEGKKYAKTILNPLFNNHHEITHIVAVVRDITNEKLTEAEFLKTITERDLNDKRYQSLFHQNPDAIFSFDLNGRIVNGNKAVEKATGYNPLELIGCTLDMLVVKENVELVNKPFLEATYGATEVAKLTIRKKTGNCVDFTCKFIPLIVDDDVVGLYGILKNITKIVHAHEQLEDSEERFRIIAEHARDLISLLNNKGEFIYASPSYKEILGYDFEEYVGKFFLHNIHHDDQQHVKEKITEAIQYSIPFKVRFRQRNSNNQYIWMEADGTPVLDQQNHLKHMVVLTRNIHLQKKYESELEYVAHHDVLTNLPNRRLFNQKLKEALIKFKQLDGGLAVIFLDIDYFKVINDELGHDFGDEVIVEFGRRVRESIRNQDLVARLGGDEFVILLTNIERIHVTAIAEQILQAMHQPWIINGKNLNITTSMGIAIATRKSATKAALLKHADMALYKAKRKGRNQYFIHDSEENNE